MKHLSTALLFAFAFLFIHATYANTLKESETTKIFNQINTDKDTTLEGEEIEKAFTAAATKLFEKAKFHKDEDLISALAKQYAKESKSKLTKEEFKSSIDKLFKFAKNFREEAYTEVLKKLEMNEVLSDPDLLKEVISKPEVYGLTYGSSNEVFDELEKVYKETADTIKEIQAQFEELLSKKEESHESVGDKVTFRQLGEVKEGVHKVQEGAQEVGHKVQEGVHAGVHRVQEGVQETVNTVKEKVEEVKHKVEEAKDKAETKAEATADSVKGTVQGNNAAQDAVNKAKETVEDVKNTAQAAGHRVEETVHAAGHTVQEGVQHVGNKIDETVEQVKHRVEETGTKAGNRADEAKDRLQENAQKTAESVKEKAHDAADAVKEGLHLQREKTLTEKLTEAAGTIFDDHVNPVLQKIGAALGLHKKDEGVKGKVEDAVQHAKDKVKEGVDKVKDKLSGDDEEL